MYPNQTGPGSGDKFLGKEVEYDKLLFDMLKSILGAIIRGDTGGYISLVNHVESTFPYKDQKYIEAIKNAQETLNRRMLETRNKFGKDDQQQKEMVNIEFAHKKYYELVELFKRKKKFPQEAEEEEF